MGRRGDVAGVVRSRSFLELAINLLMLFQEQESENGMRTDTYETRDPSLEHPAQALCARDVCYEAHNAALVFGAHDSCLDDVDGRAYGRRDEARHERGRKVRREVILQRGMLQQDPFEDVVGR